MVLPSTREAVQACEIPSAQAEYGASWPQGPMSLNLIVAFLQSSAPSAICAQLQPRGSKLRVYSRTWPETWPPISMAAPLFMGSMPLR